MCEWVTLIGLVLILTVNKEERIFKPIIMDSNAENMPNTFDSLPFLNEVALIRLILVVGLLLVNYYKWTLSLEMNLVNHILKEVF